MVSKNKFDQLVQQFQNPVDENSIWCYWYWVGDDISKDGITKDLEAMKEAGIGAVLIGNINPEEKDGKVPILSEDWWDHMVHAVNEGKRIGVDIGTFNCPGWSMSGGPWISSDKAMRHMIYSETTVSGGKQLELKLVKPKEEFQDLYVLAFPSVDAEGSRATSQNAKIEITPSISGANKLFDEKTSTTASFSYGEKKYQIDILLDEPIKARSLQFIPTDELIKGAYEVKAQIDEEFITIKTFRIDRTKLNVNVGPYVFAPIAIRLPETVSSKFRIVFTNEIDQTDEFWTLSEIILSEAAIVENYAEKSLGKMHPTPFPKWDSYIWNKQNPVDENGLSIKSNDVFDISSNMDEEGLLTWKAPEGNWTIQRFGLTPTGTMNSPAAPQGKGYEVDKANKELVRFHFEQFIGEFLKRIPEESKSAFKYVVADSYEMGSQNWTDDFEQSFEKKYGYNPKKYLPVFSGRIVGSVTESDRFLWDLRRAVADDVAYKYVGGLREISNEHGLKLWLENYGHWGYPSEFLMYGGQSDFVSGEYWNEGTLGDIECKAASSAAHIYGKKTTSAECFTAARRTYVRHPAMLKKRGDWSLTEGINHHVLHLYIHQPDDNKVPGTNAWFSTEFNRHNTWFKQGQAYFNYLRRAQHMLQQGNYVADVCYFIGEDAPIMTGATNPELPKGYSFDYINAEVIMNNMSVKDGKLVLSHGVSYSMMVLPPLETMRPELLTKLEQLVSEGGIVYGQAPKTSPSLQNYPQSDDQVQTLASKLWAGEEKVKNYGKGTIIDGLPIQEALDKFSIRKDVDVSDDVLWTHREIEGMEIYFLTNQSGKEISVNPSFRVDGLMPQLWDAVTGQIRALPEFEVADGRTIIPLKMEADRSWFVVFSNAENDFVEKGINQNTPTYKVAQTLDSFWKIDFENQKISTESINTSELFDWSKSEGDLLKYYSGTANYTTFFDYKKSSAKEVFIDLGKVGVMATVTLNGKNVGTTWIAPYRLNISDAIQEGENKLEVKVVNVWRNRLTGDKTLPEDQRTTSVLIDHITPEEKLISSGLMGPVTVRVVN